MATVRDSGSRLRNVASAARLGVVLAIVLATSCPVDSARADDLNPPPWGRLGEANFSTSAEWNFLAGSDPFFPDGDAVPLIVGNYAGTLNDNFPNGAPHPSGVAFGDLTPAIGSWEADLSGEGGTLAFNIPNWVDTEPVKHLRLQVTWGGSQEPTTGVHGFFSPNGGPSDADERLVDHVPGTTGELLYFYDDWDVFPNPYWEQVLVNVPPGTTIHQVVIDTISTPEPSTLLLAAIGLFACAAFSSQRRRRRG